MPEVDAPRAGVEAFLCLLRTAHRFERAHAEFLRPYGLTPTQYNALRILRGARPEALPCQEVGRRMITPVPDVTRLLDRLEAKRLVARRRDPTDRRSVPVEILPTGLELLARIDAPLAAWHRDRLGHLSPGELERLAQLLRRAADGLE